MTGAHTHLSTIASSRNVNVYGDDDDGDEALARVPPSTMKIMTVIARANDVPPPPATTLNDLYYYACVRPFGLRGGGYCMNIVLAKGC